MFFGSGGQNHNSIILLYFVILGAAGISYIYGHPTVNKLHIPFKKKPKWCYGQCQIHSEQDELEQKQASEDGNTSGMVWRVRQEKMSFFLKGKGLFSLAVQVKLAFQHRNHGLHFSGRRLCARDISLLELHSLVLYFHSLPRCQALVFGGQEVTC